MQVSPVPTRISLRGLKRCSTTGPTHSVNSAASGKPNVMSARVAFMSRMK